ALAHDTQPYGANRRMEDATPPPTRLPPACGTPLPSVLVSPGLVRDVRRAEERPPRRRVHSTAEIARSPQRLTARIGVVGATVRKLRSGSWGYLLMLVPVAAVVAALLAI